MYVVIFQLVQRGPKYWEFLAFLTLLINILLDFELKWIQ